MDKNEKIKKFKKEAEARNKVFYERDSFLKERYDEEQVPGFWEEREERVRLYGY